MGRRRAGIGHHDDAEAGGDAGAVVRGRGDDGRAAADAGDHAAAVHRRDGVVMKYI